ncbi:ASCH domain-containing protein [Roseivivax halodurans]|uniref:ASCH domain-containing protein n=1 Tax=Roseivivax halodurans TaxID=93683 RepID=UPI000A00C3B6|nr:ASCH domain-containing protein [Roseivivax halodurans]
MIRDPYLTDIVAQKKCWEIRGFQTKIRGRIGLIKSRSGHVFGEATLADVLGPLTLEKMFNTPEIGPNDLAELEQTMELPYADEFGNSKTYAWVLTNIVAYQPPVPYQHPSGAVTFVDLEHLRNDET